MSQKDVEDAAVDLALLMKWIPSGYRDVLTESTMAATCSAFAGPASVMSSDVVRM